MMYRNATLAVAVLLGTGSLASGATTAPPARTIHIKNFAFVPASLTIPAGTRVTFINDDDEPHTVTATDKSFDSEGLDKNARWSHTFAKAGTSAYFCELHPMMHGRVVVLAAGGSAK
jgi:plastocyanin